MNKLASQSALFLKRNAPTILTCIGGIGVIATAITVAKDTPKALSLIEKAEYEKGEELTTLEKVKVASHAYIPSVITGASTIACIFGANALNKRNQSALMSAYALLDNTYKKYREGAEALYGEEANIDIQEEMAKADYKEHTRVEDDKQLFYDHFSGRYFESTIEDVQRAEYRLNRDLVMRDYAYLNEFYEHLGIPTIESGYKLGWTTGGNLDRYWQSWIDFDHEKVSMEDGMECFIIVMQEEPYLDFEDYC